MNKPTVNPQCNTPVDTSWWHHPLKFPNALIPNDQLSRAEIERLAQQAYAMAIDPSVVIAVYIATQKDGKA